MSHTKTISPKLTRRSLLAGTAVTIGTGLTASGLSLGMTGLASAATSRATTGEVSNLCIAHHGELAAHLKSILNASYVDERMKNKVLSTSHCPHCKVAIAPDMLSREAFAAL